MGASHYIEYKGKLTEVTELCFQQFYELCSFLSSHGVVSQPSVQADRLASGGSSI